MIKILRDYSMVVIGSILAALTISALLIPCNIGSGGVTGISLCLNHLFGLKIGLVTLLINVPLFIFGFSLLGKQFAFKSGLSVVITSVALDFFNSAFKFKPMEDMLLASIFTGVAFGICFSIIFMFGGSSGGTDILAKIISNRFKTIQLSKLLLVMDAVVYTFVAIVMGPHAVMYAIVCSFVRSKTMDAMQEGLFSSRQCIIICDNSDAITSEIQTQLGRGVTVISATGGYTNNDKKVLYVVIQKGQLGPLRSLVNSVESTAFIAVSPVNDIVGNYRNKQSLL